MYFTPDHKLNILTEAEFGEGISRLEDAVNACKVTGNFKSFDGVNIYYEYFLTNNSRGNIVIVHGLSEFIQKFYEFTYYLLNQGYNVFVFDQRCHGYSDRLTDEMDLLHVDSFDDYVKDLQLFIDRVVTPVNSDPLYIYAHSMGGAVTAQYLAEKANRDKIKKAVLAAPMFEPIVKNVAFPIAKWSVALARLFVGGKKKFVLSREFDPDVRYDPAFGSSRARWEHNIRLRRDDPHFRGTPMSFGWVKNSLWIGGKLLRKRVTDKIRTPILLLSAQEDTTVRNAPQRRFADMCKVCRFVEIEHTNHAVLAADHRTLTHIMNLILNFYDLD